MDVTYIELDEIGIGVSEGVPDPGSHAWDETRSMPDADDLSDGQLVPDEIQGELIDIRDRGTRDCFRIGDIANMMVIRAAEIGFRVQAYRVRRAVGRFCGKTERTVRYYAETSAFYPANIRNIYDVLPFSHFVFARSMGSRWLEVLDYSMLKPEATVAELQRHFLEMEDRPESQPVISESHDRQMEEDVSSDPGKMREVSHISASQAAPSPQAAVMERVNLFGDLLSAADRAAEYVERAEIPAELKVDFIQTAEDLRSIISEILAAIG